MRHAVLFLALLTAACGGANMGEPPVVDQRGVDPVKFQADQAECVHRGAEAGKGFALGAVTTNCMKDKGYTILIPRG